MVLRWLDRRWPAWLLIGLTAAGAFMAMPEVWHGYLVSAASGLMAIVCTFVAIRRHRPGNRGGWVLFVAGIGTWSAADLTITVLTLTGHATYPSVADLLYIAAYPMLAVALFQVSGNPGRKNVSAIIDGAIVASGLSLVYWIIVVGPIVADASVPVAQRVTTIAYIFGGVVLVGGLTPMLFLSPRSTPSAWLLRIGSASVLVANIVYVLAPVESSTMLAYAGYVFTYCCWAGAVVHPSVAERPPAHAGPEPFGRSRFAILAAATLVVPGVIIYEGSRQSWIDWRVVGAGAILLFLLVLSRMAGFVGQVQRQSKQLEDLAMRDDLTGLGNRRLFEDRLAALPGTGSPQVAILDLNNFKDVNDRFGHAYGDCLLEVIAMRLSEAVRDGDLVARMGGDEFAVLLSDAPVSAMKGLVERISAVLRRPVRAFDQELLVGVSIGYADGTGIASATEVLRRADIAMYEAKQLGGARSVAYTPDMDHRAGERSRIAADLRIALDTDQLHLVYQPIVELPAGRVVAVEALVRWHHPIRGTIAPNDFIPVAEQSGLIVELGAWVLSVACYQAAHWVASLDAGAPDYISVNVSARQIAEPGFAEFVADVLEETKLPPQRLVVEVTETAVFGGGQAVQAVTALSRLGVRIALDDFGTGHSSLGLLQTVPVDILKVDKSFVDNITMAGRHAVIATALIQVAGGLGLAAVAEGVETAEQAAELHRLGYHFAQGYHFGRPVEEPVFPAKAAVLHP